MNRLIVLLSVVKLMLFLDLAEGKPLLDRTGLLYCIRYFLIIYESLVEGVGQRERPRRSEILVLFLNCCWTVCPYRVRILGDSRVENLWALDISWGQYLISDPNRAVALAGKLDAHIKHLLFRLHLHLLFHNDLVRSLSAFILLTAIVVHDLRNMQKVCSYLCRRVNLFNVWVVVKVSLHALIHQLLKPLLPFLVLCP